MICTLIMVAITYFYLARKKRIYNFQKKIKEHLEIWITKTILEEDTTDEAFYVPPKFNRLFQHKDARQIAIDEIINSKKSLSGTAAKNLIRLYDQMDFKNDSLEKLKSKDWELVAKGIQELSLMEYNKAITKIYRLTNSKEEFVRDEAQLAIIYLSGFKGLRFLNVVKYPITEWQSIKLLEMLPHSGVTDMQDLPKWLQSSNYTVVVFALKLVAKFQQFEFHDQVVACLAHENELVRYYAIKALSEIATEDTASILLAHFQKETQRNQIQILKDIVEFGSEDITPLLISIIENANPAIQLKASIALAKISKNGLAYLAEKVEKQVEPFEKILAHVKYELE